MSGVRSRANNTVWFPLHLINIQREYSVVITISTLCQINIHRERERERERERKRPLVLYSSSQTLGRILLDRTKWNHPFPLREQTENNSSSSFAIRREQSRTLNSTLIANYPREANPANDNSSNDSRTRASNVQATAQRNNKWTKEIKPGDYRWEGGERGRWNCSEIYCNLSEVERERAHGVHATYVCIISRST